MPGVSNFFLQLNWIIVGEGMKTACTVDLKHHEQVVLGGKVLTDWDRELEEGKEREKKRKGKLKREIGGKNSFCKREQVFL